MSYPNQSTAMQQPPTKQGNGWGVAAMVVGIVAIVASIIPILGLVAFILGPVAIILAIIGLTRNFRPKGTSIAGLVTGVLSMIIAGIVTALVGSFVTAVDQEMNNPSTGAPITVLYEVESDGATALITYATLEGDSFGQEQANGAELPWSNEFEVEQAENFNFNLFTLSAQAEQGATEISCRITVDGEIIAEQTSTGEFANVTCSSS